MNEQITKKLCSKCKQIKSIDKYYKGRNACIECARRYNRQYNHSIAGHIHVLWNSIRSRCSKPNDIAYKYYGGRGIQNKFKSHRDLFDYIVNVLAIDPRGLEIDRINNNSNYEKGNIRFVSATANKRNRRGSSAGTSIYKGVSWHKRVNKWIARIKHNNKDIHLGCFSSEQKAAISYDRAALKYFGEYAYLNFPKSNYEKDNTGMRTAC